MTDFHQVIFDRDALVDYIDNFLPDLGPNEWYYAALFARKKYTDQPIQYPNKGDKSQVARIISKKDRLLNKIERLEVKKGVYKARNGVEIPQESLAFYICPNPRDSYKSTFIAIKEFAEVAINSDPYYDPVSNLRSIIHRTKSKDSPFTIFDIDSSDESVLDKVRAITSGNHRVLVTRGGFHIYIHKNDIDQIAHNYGKLWYPELMKLSDQHGDMMSPVPGTTQGGHVPYFKPKQPIYTRQYHQTTIDDLTRHC